MNERIYSVYIHIFKNGKVYIGITKRNPKERWKNGKGYKRNIVLYKAIEKYGWENIEHKVLYSNLTKEEAEQKEIELIAKYNSTNHKFGYNVDNGGNCIGTHSLKTRKKLSEINKGKKLSQETIEKMRKRMIGNKYNLGKKINDEKKEKLRKINSKKVRQLDLEGNYIKTYNSTREAQRDLQIQHICEVCNGKRKSIGGYKWEYEV